jgi:hypothetical protein
MDAAVGGSAALGYTQIAQVMGAARGVGQRCVRQVRADFLAFGHTDEPFVPYFDYR